jgi:hypothetical protein
MDRHGRRKRSRFLNPRAPLPHGTGFRILVARLASIDYPADEGPLGLGSRNLFASTADKQTAARQIHSLGAIEGCLARLEVFVPDRTYGGTVQEPA